MAAEVDPMFKISFHFLFKYLLFSALPRVWLPKISIATGLPLDFWFSGATIVFLWFLVGSASGCFCQLNHMFNI